MTRYGQRRVGFWSGLERAPRGLDTVSIITNEFSLGRFTVTQPRQPSLNLVIDEHKMPAVDLVLGDVPRHYRSQLGPEFANDVAVNISQTKISPGMAIG